MSALNLLDLNDDCLLHILEYLSLPETFRLLDLYNSRLTEAAHNRIKLCKELSFSLREFPVYNQLQLSIIARSLRRLIISAGYSLPSEKVLHILRPLCSQGTALQQLTLHYVNFDVDYLDCLQSVAPQLTHLDLSFCQLTDEMLEPILKACKELQKLRLLGNYAFSGTALKTFELKNLQSVEWEQHESWILDFDAYCEQHPDVLITAYRKGRQKKDAYVPKNSVRTN